MKRHIALAVLALTSFACGQGGGADAGIGGWTVIAAPPDAGDIASVWMDGPNNVWISSAGGVGNWNGNSWTLPVAANGPAPAAGVWGFSSVTDIWAGTSFSPSSAFRLIGLGWQPYALMDTRNVTAYWGSSPVDVWGTGPSYRGHFDGSGWTHWDDYPAVGVWGTSATDAWTVGPLSSFSHWNGSGWTAVQSPAIGFSAGLAGVWGADTKDYWAVADGGTIARYDGTQWNNVPSPTHNDLNAVWGTSIADVWAVGAKGTVLHWDGQVWSVLHPPVTSDLTGVFGGAHEVWLVGTGGVVVRGH